MPSSADIEQLAMWLAATDIATLELRGAGGLVRLSRRGVAVDDSGPAQAGEGRAAPHGVTIVADTPGIFLHGHPLRENPLVECDGEVRPGQIVGLLRVGAVLLPVRATQGGRVAGYWTEDGAAVGYGAPLVELHVSETAS